jgi:hypothetical protein
MSHLNLNLKISCFLLLEFQKKLNFFPKNSNFIIHPPINTPRLKNQKNSNFPIYFMYHVLFVFNYFLKFIIHKMNYKIVKSEIMVLTRKEKTDVTGADVVMNWML